MSNKAILNYLFRNSLRAAGDPAREEMDEDAEERRTMTTTGLRTKE